MTAPLIRVGLVVALPQEGRAVARAMGETRRCRTGGVHRIKGMAGGEPVAVAWAGIGERNAGQAADALLQDGAALLLAVGFAGALAPGLSVGDLLVATEVASAAGERWHSDAVLLDTASARDEATLLERGVKPSAQRGAPTPAIHLGPLLTSARIVTTAKEKRRLGEETGALAVDMESAAVMRRATAAGVPALALRVISDAADESLPLDLSPCFEPDGQFHLAPLMLLLARRPGAVGPLARLARQSARAGRSLTAFLSWYLPRVAADQSPTARDVPRC